MALAQNLVDSADSLIDKLGKTATFSYDVSESYDATTGDVTHVGPATFDAKVGPPSVVNGWQAGDVLKRGQTQMVVAGKNLTTLPALGMTVVYRSRTWMIEKVEELDSGHATLIAAYLLTLGGGGS